MRHLLFSLFLAASPALANETSHGGTGDIGGNGGDGFSVGGAVLLFDDVEFANDFVPNAQAEFAATLAPVMKRLKDELKLPAFTRVLEDSLYGRTTLWHFVDVNLRDVGNEGSTNLAILAFNKVQVAVNRDDIVQIDRAAYEKMAPASRARLFLHEALWTGLNGAASSGGKVRQLVGLIARETLPPRPNFINFARQIIGESDSSLLLSALAEDAASMPTRIGCRGDLFGRFVTTGGGCRDIQSGLIWSRGRSDKDPGLVATMARHAGRDEDVLAWLQDYKNTAYCRDLRDGGYGDWRTATTRDLFTLDADAVAHVLPMTDSALAAARIWAIDQSYIAKAGGDNMTGEIVLRSIDRATWDVVPFGPSGIVIRQDGRGGVIHEAGPNGTPGYAVFCVRGDS